MITKMPSCSLQPVQQCVNEFAVIVDAAFGPSARSRFSASINKQLEALPATMDTAGARVEVALVRLQIL